MLRAVNGGKIHIGDWDFPYNPKIPPGHNLSAEKIVLCLKDLQEIKSVFDFLGTTSPIDIMTFNEKDFRLLKALSGHVVNAKKYPALFKSDGIKTLWIGKYPVLVLAYQERIVNVFSLDYLKTVQLVLDTNDEILKISPYFWLNSEAIGKTSNFNGKIVVESIKEHPYSPSAGGWYNGLLLEAIKAMDIAPDNKQIAKFSNDLADYLLENEDSVVHRLNKMQICKRLAPLGNQDTDWLLAERDRQEDSSMLCGIAILLDDLALFDEQFALLTPEQQETFRTYPIMKLHKEGNTGI
jgi:hypothetical protein